MTQHTHRSGQYGIDAPYAPIGMAVGGIICLVMACLSQNLWETCWFGVWTVLLLGMASSFFYTSRRGKFVVWARIVEGLRLAGDEQALDLGCGRGLVLLEVARHLPRGEAVGIDLWRSRDQSGNNKQATLANARAEGVAERVRLETGDMAKLPFPDASFDLVTSSLAIHNMPAAADRQKAIDEAVRVLRPGGRLAIADMRHTRAHAERLHALGLTDVARRNLGWRFWYGGPLWATHLVSARKP
ncbi:MAG TPA: class I SAM-dependent methyltransferase [Rhodanobacteraceae bacterium]